MPLTHTTTAQSPRRPARALGALLALCAVLGLPQRALGQVSDVAFADVTVGSFSVVWVSAQAVTSATVQVFADPGGTQPLTGSLVIELVSQAFPPALALGIVKVRASGLSAGQTVYVQTETTTGSGVSAFPAAPPFLAVTAARQATRVSATARPIGNDLVLHDVLAPDGAPAPGALLLVEVPGVSAYPLSAFVGENVSAPGALVDANNFYTGSGVSLHVTGGETLRLLEYRGLLCAATTDHLLERSRRAPVHTEAPPISEAETPASCFSPGGVGGDFDCNGRIDEPDYASFMARFGLLRPNCGFHDDYDFDDDARVGLVDFTRMLSVFGTQE